MDCERQAAGLHDCNKPGMSGQYKSTGVKGQADVSEIIKFVYLATASQGQ